MGSALKSKNKKNTTGLINYPKDKVKPHHENYKYYRWCINNNIVIMPVAELRDNWYIRITINGKTNISPERYSKNIWEKVHEFYKYYYDKYYKEND